MAMNALANEKHGNEWQVVALGSKKADISATWKLAILHGLSLTEFTRNPFELRGYEPSVILKTLLSRRLPSRHQA